MLVPQDIAHLLRRVQRVVRIGARLLVIIQDVYALYLAFHRLLS